jgi:hypothetical protein
MSEMGLKQSQKAAVMVGQLMTCYVDSNGSSDLDLIYAQEYEKRFPIV